MDYMKSDQISQANTTQTEPPIGGIDIQKLILAVAKLATDFVTAAQLAKQFGLQTTVTVDRWIKMGLLPPYTSPVKSSNRGWAAGTLNAFFATKGELAAFESNRPCEALCGGGDVAGQDVGIVPLGYRHRRVAKQQRDVKDGNAAQQHLCGKPVSKRVRAEILDAASLGG
jgi:hypothetical protein